MPHANMLGLPILKGNQATMAREGVKAGQQQRTAKAPRPHCICESAPLPKSQSHCSDDWIPHNETVQLCNGLCGPTDQVWLRASSENRGSNETIEGKRAFEALARREGVRVENYHADNGIFKANLWVDERRKEG